jgi:cytochrome c oxidase assembly protein subunit 15
MYKKLSGFTLLLTYSVIILGAATRVYGAGMSCPDWPTCYGVWNPFHPDAMPPGGFIVNEVIYERWQVALEWTHRLLAALVGVCMLLLAFGAVKRPRHEWLPLGVAFLLLLVQVKLGAVTVWLGNVNWSVSLHLGTAMLLFGALVWHRRAVAAGPPPYHVPTTTRPLKVLAIALAPLVLLLMMVGAYVSSSYAGGVCGGLFSCDGQWWPADFQQHTHMMHRYLAFTLLAASIVFLSIAKRKALWLAHAARAFHGMVWVQAALGVATLYSFTLYPGYYEILSIAHLAWGTLVWLVALGAALNLKYGVAGRFHG